MPEHGFGQKRDVAGAAHVPFVDGKAFWPPEIAINKRRVKLQSEAVVDFIADDELRDRTIQSLPGGIGNFMVVELQRAEMGELLGDRGVEPGQENFLLRHRFHLRALATAQIASARGQRKKRQCDNQQPTQHRVCSTHGDRSRQLAGADWQ
jgi:hypothetical protein